MTLLSLGPGTAGRRRGVTVLSGFLGSGKTTLLRAELRRTSPDCPTVVLNDLGRHGADDLLLGEGGAAPAVISGGCVCCTRREHLASVLRELLDAGPREPTAASDHVVLETSGLSDPGPIAFTIANDPVLRHHYALARTCVTVDAVTGPSSLGRHEVARRQLQAADDLFVTKSDMVTGAVVDDLVRHLRGLNPTARIAVTAGGELVRREEPQSALVPRRWCPDGVATGHLQDVRTVELVTADALDWQAFSVWLTLLLHRHGPDVLRVKGVVEVDGAGPVAVNGVQHVVHAPEHLSGPVPEGTRLVLVLRGLDPGLVERSFYVLQDLQPAQAPS